MLTRILYIHSSFQHLMKEVCGRWGWISQRSIHSNLPPLASWTGYSILTLMKCKFVLKARYYVRSLSVFVIKLYIIVNWYRLFLIGSKTINHSLNRQNCNFSLKIWPQLGNNGKKIAWCIFFTKTHFKLGTVVNLIKF